MGKPAEKLADNSIQKKIEKLVRVLIAGVDTATQEVLAGNVKEAVVGADFSYAADGVEALFKLSNVSYQLVFLAKDLPKRTGVQITEWLSAHDKLVETAVILLCGIPENEKFVDDVVIGRVQFLPDINDKQKLEKTVSRAMNYVTQGDKSEFHLKFLASGAYLLRQGDKAESVYLVKKGRLKAIYKSDKTEEVLGTIEVGEFVGEMAYINGEARLADVIAETPCELIEIPVSHLDSVLFQKPAWAKALMMTLSKRLKSRDTSTKQKAETT